jgi:hypothetical protein
VTYQPGLGDAGITQIQGEVGRLIRLGQWLNGDGFADFEHAFVYIGDGQIVEAEPGGARIAQLAEYDARTVAWLRCPPEYRENVAAAARSLEGTPYSFLDYVAIAAHRLHIPAPGLKRLIGRRRICSALADAAADMGGWHWYADDRWYGDVTPADIWGLIRTQDAMTPPPAPPKRNVVPGSAA